MAVAKSYVSLKDAKNIGVRKNKVAAQLCLHQKKLKIKHHRH